MKRKTLTNIITVLVVLVVFAVCAFTIGSVSMIDCDLCGGDGTLPKYTCVSCTGEGVVDEDMCTHCAGQGGLESIECPDCEGVGQIESGSRYYKTIMALMPPVIAIILALVTKEVYSSLFVGIVSAGLLVSEFRPIATLNTVLNDGFIASLADSWNVGILIFLVLLGIIVSLINKAGGSKAFGNWAKKHIKTRVGAQLATFALGILIFVDDYFNCLTVGSVMRPVTDAHKISRAKLSYLIDATAAPICMIAPISSWAAAVSGVVEGQNGLELFIKAIPYNFYSLLTIFMIIAISLMKFDYGPMRRHELNALSGDLHSGANTVLETTEEETDDGKKRSVWDLVFPVIILIASCITGMMYSGGFFTDGVSFVDAFAGCDASVALSWGAIIALIVTIIYLIARKVITFKDAMECVPNGFIAMVPPILILTFAWTLSGLTGMLGADVYVAGLMEGAAQGLTNLLPAIIFLVAVGLSFSTGTSWGTFGILIPIVVSVFSAEYAILTIGISACLAGAVCGDHCSPISDTTIMSSAGAKCNHINHVSTQLPYALTVAAVSFVGYVIAGFVQNWLIVLPLSMLIMLSVLFVIRSTQKKA